VQLRNDIIIEKTGLGGRDALHPHRGEAVVQPLAQVVAGFQPLCDSKGVRHTAQRGFVRRKMLAPHLAKLAHRAGVGRAIEQGIEIERMPLHLNELDERIGGHHPPVRDQLEAGPRAVRRMLHLGIAGALEERLRLRIRKGGVGEIGIAEFPGLHVPFALEMVAKDGLPVMVLRRLRRVIFDEHVIEGLGAGLVADPDDPAHWVKQQGGMQPEEARLKIISVFACDDGLGHVL
jgi:hypothetical protein